MEGVIQTNPNGCLCALGLKISLPKVNKFVNFFFMTWMVSFYNEKVEKQTLGFPKSILANFLHIVEMIEEFGPSLGKPHTAPMGDGLFEIRAKGKEGIGRSLFCMQKGKEIVILHSFVKKTQKTPKKELDLARKRLKELDND